MKFSTPFLFFLIGIGIGVLASMALYDFSKLKDEEGQIDLKTKTTTPKVETKGNNSPAVIADSSIIIYK